MLWHGKRLGSTAGTDALSPLLLAPSWSGGRPHWVAIFESTFDDVKYESYISAVGS